MLEHYVELQNLDNFFLKQYHKYQKKRCTRAEHALASPNSQRQEKEPIKRYKLVKRSDESPLQEGSNLKTFS